MRKNKVLYAICICFLLVCTSCAHKSGHNRIKEDRTGITTGNDGRKVKGHTKVQMRKENGVYLVPITVNGLNLDFVFDTGASNISISSAEAAVMYKQGQITQDDIVGRQQFQDATGGISVGTVIRLRSVEIGGISLQNVEASVTDNINAPLLLGQTALAKFGKVTIDYDANTIEFN